MPFSFRFFSFLSPLDLFDPLLRLSRYFQIFFVYRDSDVYQTSFLSLYRCFHLLQYFIVFQICLSIAIFYRVPDMFRLLQSSFAIQLCFFYYNLHSQSSQVSSIVTFFHDIDMFRLSCLIFFRDRFQ